MTDSIELRDLRVVGRHGVLPFEQEHPQPFRIDLDIHIDVRQAGKSDDLSDTVDYGTTARRIAELVSAEQHALMERVAERIAEEVLFDRRITSVDVSVTKLRPPVPVDLGTATVRIRRP